MRLRTAICCTLLGITLVSISVISTVLQNASAQSVPDFSLPGMTGSPPVRSGMWINNGTWWAIFSDNTSGTYFYKKVGNEFVKGSQVNPVVDGSPDTIWDGTSLFVFLQESAAQAKLYKYTYTASPEQYDLIPGFPVTIPLAGMAVSATIAKDSTEKLWVAYAGGESGAGGDSSIHVIWSTSPDHLTWDTTGLLLETGTAAGATEVAAAVAFNDGVPKVGVFWSNQTLGEYAFKYHADAELETNWSAKETVDTNGSGGPGVGIAGEFASVKAAPDGRVLALGMDEIGNGHVHLYVRSTSGTWSPRVLVNTSPTTIPSRPLLLLDTENNAVFCFYRDSSFNKTIHYTRADLSNPTTFQPQHVFINTNSKEPTSTKQYLNSSTDLIVASTSSGTIYWNLLDLSTSPTASFTATPTSGDAPLAVNFTDTSTDDNGITSHLWNFGDGYTSTAANPTHVFRPGTWNVTLQVTDTGGNQGISAPQSIVVTDVGIPVIQAISPAAVNNNNIVGDFTITVDGGTFISGAVVRFNGIDRPTTFVDATRLTATLTQADVATAGAFPITVAQAGPVVSNALNLTVSAEIQTPTITSISPTTVAQGSPPFDLIVDGTNFVATSKIWVNGTERVTTYVSPTQLKTNISSDLAFGLYQIPVSVVNPLPGGESNIVTFNITPVCPTPAPAIQFAGRTAFNSVHSQLWYNDGRWWAAISDNVDGVYFWSHSNGAFVKGARIDTNRNAGADTLWNGTNLFVLTYQTSAQGRLYKYSYNATTKTYTLVTGFPVNIPLTGLASSLTFIQDSTGKLWATYTGSATSAGDDSVHVIWTTSADHITWNTTGFVLESGLSQSVETSAITVFGGNKVGVAWSNQALNQVAFMYHTDGDAENIWSAKEVVNSGVGAASDSLSIKGLPDGRLLLAQLDNIGNKHVNLFKRDASGIWDPKIEVTRNPTSVPTNPMVVFDSSNSEVYVLYREGASSSTAVLHFAHMNINSHFMPASCPIGLTGVTVPTSTKQTVNATTDLAVAARRSSNENLVIQDVTAPPPPTLVAMSPEVMNAGDPDFIMTLDGTNFSPALTVRFNGIECPTTFVSSTQLTAQVPAARVAAGGLFPVTVAASDEVQSNALTFSVDNLFPTLTSISPTTLPAGNGAFELTAIGANLNGSTIIRFNGVNHPVTAVSSTEVRAQIAAIEISNVGIFPVVVVNPSPGGGQSDTLNFTTTTIAPTLTSINPTSATAGGAALVLTVNGADFNPGTVVRWNGVNRVTSFVNSTQLTAQITAADIQGGGVFPITVANAGPMLSAAVNFTVNNPVPQVTTLSPTNATAGAASFTLTVNGTGFVPGSVVRFNGDLPANDRTTVFVSGTQLTASITAADIASAGTFAVKVFNPVPVGGTSNAVNFTVSNPVPTLTTLSPATATAGAANFTLTVNGTNFNSGSAVRINTVDRTTTFISSTQLSVQITSADVASSGNLAVAVFNAAPGGGLTATVQLPISNPVPSITTLSPASNTTGSAAFTMTVNGTNFVPASAVRFNGNNRTTTFVNSTQLQAQINAADVATAGTANITVFNPTPGGGTSPATTFTINNATPTIVELSPASVAAGGSTFTLTVNGTSFINGSIVRFNGTDRTTTFASATQLTIQVSASDIATASIASITVFTPAPGGGTSSGINLTINNPVPTLTTISPNTKVLGAAAFTLQVNGTNFKDTSVIRYNGSDRPTTFVNSTELTAQISANDLLSSGLYPIVVFTPTPGGGSSSAVNFSVTNPVPTITTLSPSTLMQGGPSFELTVNGSGFSNTSVVAWNGNNRPTTFVSATQLKAQITADDINVASAVNVTVNNPSPGGGTSNASAFTVAPNPRLLKLINASGAPAGIGTVTIQLVAQGDENAMGFSLSYDPSILSNPMATLGVDAASATLNVNPSQIAQGRFGIALSLPSGSSFPAGVKNLVVVTFNVADVGSMQTPINFADQPVGREVANTTADVLATAFIPTSMAISTGLEGDVAPRPGGSNNGTVSVADWVQVGRFSAGVDTIGPGLEYQKADCAPRNTLGNGAITVSDWVQAGRYAAGVDPTSAAGGPTAPSTTAPTTGKASENPGAEALTIPTVVYLRDTLTQSGDEESMSVELDAQGSENGLGFSLMFDPQKFRFTSAEIGVDAESGILQVNHLGADKGRLGIAVALPTGQSFRAGTNQIVVLKFTRVKSAEDHIALTFTDLPVTRELVAVDASNLKVSFETMVASRTNPIDDAQYFVYQHYLDILGRSPDGLGLDYWTSQITSCGANDSCIHSRRIDVSDAFFTEREFQHTGAYVHRVYKSAFGVNLTYSQFMAERGGVSGNTQELDRSKTDFTTRFTERSDFLMRYPLTMSAGSYVDALNANTGYSLTAEARDQLVRGLADRSESRGSVLRKVAENEMFVDREYNTSFVLTQYYGYLRRDPEIQGFDFWLGQMNRFPLRDLGIQRSMICSFITSPEYRLRFGPILSGHQCR